MNDTILITGGHVTPAVALIEELSRRRYANIIYVGRKVAMEGDTALSYEYQEISKRKIRFIALTTGRLTRVISWRSFLSLFKIPIGIVQSFIILFSLRPDLIVSFGGYMAVPIVLVGYLIKIPIVTHEQTTKPGLANRLIANLSRKICISWPQTASYFPAKKVVMTGNPLRSELFEEPKTPPFPVDSRYPLVYISGGSLGAHVINEIVAKQIYDLVSLYTIVHQTGNTKLTNDFEMLIEVRKQLPPRLSLRYHVFTYLDVARVGWLYRHASLVICRAGANTITELMAFGTPAVVVPLPWSGSGEQQANAEMLEKMGVATVLPQDYARERLLFVTHSMIKHLHEYKQNAHRAKKLVFREAVSAMVDVVEEILGKV